MKKKIQWNWENIESQQVFADLVGFPNKAETSKEVDQIEKLVSIKPPLRVLDLGCGTGRHAMEMTERGYHVVGIDVAESYLEKAKREAQKRKLDIEFRFQRGAEVQEKGIYEFVLAYNHTLGFMSNVELDQHFVSIFEALSPSGRLLLVLAGPKLIPGKESVPSNSWSEKDGKLILEEKYFENGYRIERCLVIETQHDEITEFFERQKAFTMDEILSLLRRIGFKVIACLKDIGGHKATPEEFGVFLCTKTQ